MCTLNFHSQKDLIQNQNKKKTPKIVVSLMVQVVSNKCLKVQILLLIIFFHILKFFFTFLKFDIMIELSDLAFM